MKLKENETELGLKTDQPKNGRMKVLYTRVSSLDQKTDRQRVNETDFDWVIEDKISGSIAFFERNGGCQLQQLIAEGKVESVHIWSIDRCGRSMIDILQTLEYCTAHAVPVNFLSQGLRTLDDNGKENAIAKMIIGILGVMAEMQREQIREAQAQGIALAKARGVYHGRKQNTMETTLQFLSKPQNMKALELLRKHYRGAEVAKIVGMSPTTVCKIKKLGLSNSPPA